MKSNIQIKTLLSLCQTSPSWSSVPVNSITNPFIVVPSQDTFSSYFWIHQQNSELQLLSPIPSPVKLLLMQWKVYKNPPLATYSDSWFCTSRLLPQHYGWLHPYIYSSPPPRTEFFTLLFSTGSGNVSFCCRRPPLFSISTPACLAVIAGPFLHVLPQHKSVHRQEVLNKGFLFFVNNEFGHFTYSCDSIFPFCISLGE